MQTGYYGHRGQPFQDYINGVDVKRYYVRATTNEYRRITSLWTIDADTLAPQRDITVGWEGKEMPSIWLPATIDDSLLMDEGL